MGRLQQKRTQWKKRLERRRRRWREADIRGENHSEFFEKMLNFLIITGDVVKYIKSEKNSELDRKGRDFIPTLSKKFFDNIRNRDCHVDIKSSIWGLAHYYNKSEDRVLRFVPVITRPVEEEAKRFLSEGIAHIKKVDALMKAWREKEEALTKETQ